MEYYTAIKVAHILSSTVLFGTGLGTAFHMWRTYQSGNGVAIGEAARTTVLADWLFTTPAGILQPVTGLLLIIDAGYGLFESWLVLTYGLYVLAFVCWVPVVVLQIRVRNIAVSLASSDPIPDQIHANMRTWFLLGWPAFLSLVVIYYLMVAKPELWA